MKVLGRALEILFVALPFAISIIGLVMMCIAMFWYGVTLEGVAVVYVVKLFPIILKEKEVAEDE